MWLQPRSSQVCTSRNPARPANTTRSIALYIRLFPFATAVKYGDVPALIALNAAGKLWLAGQDAPAAGGAAVTRAPADAGAEAAAEWLLHDKDGE